MEKMKESHIHSVLDDVVRYIQRDQAVELEQLKPQYPIFVLYYGERSALCHPRLFAALENVWRSAVKEVVFLQINLSGEEIVFCKFQSNGEREYQSEDDILSLLGIMLSERSIFQDRNSLMLFCIFDSCEMTNQQEFEVWYHAIDKVRGLFSRYITKSIFTLLLDEEPQNRDKADAVRRMLRDTVVSKELVYDATIILSNYTNNGMLMPLFDSDALVGDSNVISNLVFLSNTKTDSFTDIETRIYSEPQRKFTTIAYASIRKPVLCIAHSTVKRVIQVLDNERKKPCQAVENQLEGISSSMLGEVFEQWFHENFTQVLPKEDCLVHLPNYREEKHTGISYSELNILTRGCWSCFVNTHFLDKAKAHLARSKCAGLFGDKIRDVIGKEFDYRSILRLDNLSIISDDLIQKLSAYLENNTPTAYRRAMSQARLLVAEHLETTIVEEMRNVLGRADAREKAFMRLLQDFGYLNIPLTEQSVSDYYDDLAEKNMSRLLSSRETISRLYNTETHTETLEELIKSLVEDILKSNHEYSMPIYEELVTRVGGETEATHSEMRRILFGNLGERIQLRTPTAMPEHEYQLVLAGQESGIDSFLRGEDQDRRVYSKDSEEIKFVTKPRRDSVEIMRIIRCPYEIL